jgi:hypothetical protein
MKATSLPLLVAFLVGLASLLDVGQCTPYTLSKQARASQSG